MTRALGIAVVIAAVLASVILGLFFFLPGVPARRPRAPSPAHPVTIAPSVRVLAEEAADRAVVVKERFLDDRRAEFTDRSLSRALGIAEGTWRFVEVWVVNRSEGAIDSLAAPPVLEGQDGARIILRSLRELLPPDHSPLAEMLVSALSPDPLRPLRKGGFRRSVYAVPASVGFRTLVSATVDRLRLVPHETTEDALDTFMERPRPDLIAALAKPQEPADTRNRSAMTEDSR